GRRAARDDAPPFERAGRLNRLSEFPRTPTPVRGLRETVLRLDRSHQAARAAMMAPVDDDVVARWNAQRAGNRRVTLIDLSAMVAGPRGLAPHELPREERRALTEQAMGIIVPGHATIPGSDITNQPIEVVAADPEWRTHFEGYRAQLASVLGPVARRIEH